MNSFKGKNILITGGTGSLGSRLAFRLIYEFKAKKVVIFSRDELKQFEMEKKFNSSKLRFFLGDIRDLNRVSKAFKGIDMVIHAAALKQVEAAEYNPMEFVKTNILGAENIVEASLINNISKVIALSTDKAVNPINLYGATKLASDKIFVASNNLAGRNDTRFSVVRYGNVAGSRGSVIPFFKSILDKKSDELPITHEDMTRFWITLDEGIDFIHNSFLRMHGGEVFVPKIPSCKIVDLARAFGKNVKIKIVGIRPGEKLHEVMCPEDESRNIIEFNDFFIIKPSFKFIDEKINHFVTKKREIGHSVFDGFRYSSDQNKFLSIKELNNYLKLLNFL